jgi:hypothetical protein
MSGKAKAEKTDAEETYPLFMLLLMQAFQATAQAVSLPQMKLFHQHVANIIHCSS